MVVQYVCTVVLSSLSSFMYSIQPHSAMYTVLHVLILIMEVACTVQVERLSYLCLTGGTILFHSTHFILFHSVLGFSTNILSSAL